MCRRIPFPAPSGHLDPPVVLVTYAARARAWKNPTEMRAILHTLALYFQRQAKERNMIMSTNVKHTPKESDNAPAALPTLTPQQVTERTARRRAKAALMRKKNADSLR